MFRQGFTRCRPERRNVRTPDLGGTLGDTICRFAEDIAEAKLGAREGRFGCVEVVEQVLDGSVRTGIGQRMNTNFQHLQEF